MPEDDIAYCQCIICTNEMADTQASENGVSLACGCSMLELCCVGALLVRELCGGSLQSCVVWTCQVRVFTCRRVATAKDKACMPVLVCGDCYPVWVSARWPGELAVDAAFVRPRLYPSALPLPPGPLTCHLL